MTTDMTNTLTTSSEYIHTMAVSVTKEFIRAMKSRTTRGLEKVCVCVCGGGGGGGGGWMCVWVCGCQSYSEHATKS